MLIMAKGYVKALAEEINHQDALRHMNEGCADDKRHRALENCSKLLSAVKAENMYGLKQSLNEGEKAPSVACHCHSDPGYKGAISAKEHPPRGTCCGYSFPIKKQTVSSSWCQDTRDLSICDKSPREGEIHKVITQSNALGLQANHEQSDFPMLNLTPHTKTNENDSVKSPICSGNPKPVVDYSTKPILSSKKLLSCTPDNTVCKSHSLAPGNLSDTGKTLQVTKLVESLNSAVWNTKELSSNDVLQGNSIPSSARLDCEDIEYRHLAKRSSDQYRDSVFKTIYDNAPPMNPAELYDSSWSDSDSATDGCAELNEKDKDSSYGSLTTRRNDNKVTDQTEAQDSMHKKRFCIAEELLKTERDYVSRLHLLHQVFYFRLDKENRQHSFLPLDTLNHMFSNIKSIFLFHHDFLLPQLEERMSMWEKNSCIGDIMKKNAPFLKMYTEYIRNFDHAMKLINQWMEKSSRFADIIQDIQKDALCGSLSLQHHMLEPIQRVPRYELLLKDYLRFLPTNSSDRTDAKDALDLVTRAACHANDAMTKIETFQKLLDVFQSLRGAPVDFISPAREFVMQGSVTKISARSGEKQARQIFLFSDLVLLCSQHNLLGTYNVRSQLDMDSMEVKTGNNMQIPKTFLLCCKQKVVELLDENSVGESFGWQKIIKDAINNYKTRKRSIRQDEMEFSGKIHVPETRLGKAAPMWIPDDAASMCMICEVSFSVVRRRHHCRACGKLICRNCCKKAPLEYKGGKIGKVCSSCYDNIINRRDTDIVYSLKETKRHKKRGILQVKASEPGLISSYLQCSDDRGLSWQKLWVTAHETFVLYLFKAHEDICALNSLPLPGHEVHQILDIEDKHYVFRLSHKTKNIFLFETDSEEQLLRWTCILKKLVQAELPDGSVKASSLPHNSRGSTV